MQPLASAHLPHQMGFVYHFMTAHIFSITGCLSAVDWLTVHLGEQNVRDRANYSLRRAFQQIGKPYQQPSFPQSNGIVDVRESEEFYLQFRQRNVWPQLPVFIMEDFEKPLAHNEARLARRDDSIVEHVKTPSPIFSQNRGLLFRLSDRSFLKLLVLGRVLLFLEQSAVILG